MAIIKPPANIMTNAKLTANGIVGVAMLTIKMSNAHAFGFEVILQRGNERLLLDEVSDKGSKKHLSVEAVGSR